MYMMHYSLYSLQLAYLDMYVDSIVLLEFFDEAMPIGHGLLALGFGLNLF